MSYREEKAKIISKSLVPARFLPGSGHEKSPSHEWKQLGPDTLRRNVEKKCTRQDSNLKPSDP